jgi:putative endonuclease
MHLQREPSSPPPKKTGRVARPFLIPSIPWVPILRCFCEGKFDTASKLVILSGAGADVPHSRRIPTRPVVTMPRQGVLFETRMLTFSAVRDGFHYKFWVYILVSRTGTLYIGITGYFDRRISQHKMDSIQGFTEKYKVHRLVYYETYDHVQAAIRREKQLKGWRREKKIALIEKMNPRWQDLAENWGREMRFRGQAIGRTP